MDNDNVSKNGLKNIKMFGFLLGFCFAILSIYVGFMYPQSSKERQSFLDGWTYGFLSLIVVVAIGLLIFGLFSTGAKQ